MAQNSIAPSKSNYLMFAAIRPNTLISPTYRNSHPLRFARTAKSMSSTVVRSFHPPDWLIADTRHTPAVPVNRAQLQQETVSLVSWKRSEPRCTAQSSYHWSQRMSTQMILIPAQLWNDSLETSSVSLSSGKHHSSLQNHPAKARSGTSCNHNEQNLTYFINTTIVTANGQEIASEHQY